tara:strand:- start:31953 stop:32393 length:441 start_codon:yes stop_codon:yes gene_type:complete
MWPNRSGWILLATPLVIWCCGAGIVYLSAYWESRTFAAALAHYEAEMERRSVDVYVSQSGSRYHRESHSIGTPTSAVSHRLAIERGLTPCKVCNPVPIRKFPDPPSKPASIETKIRKANWTFGLVVLSWVGFFYLPDVIKRRLVRD